jgi:hypothetical protein
VATGLSTAPYRSQQTDGSIPHPGLQGKEHRVNAASSSSWSPRAVMGMMFSFPVTMPRHHKQISGEPQPWGPQSSHPMAWHKPLSQSYSFPQVLLHFSPPPSCQTLRVMPYRSSTSFFLALLNPLTA